MTRGVAAKVNMSMSSDKTGNNIKSIIDSTRPKRHHLRGGQVA